MKKHSKALMGSMSSEFILAILSNGDSYGYEISNIVTELSSGKIEWKPGSLYPALKNLENQKFIQSFWKYTNTERPRKYYKINNAGKQELKALINERTFFNDTINKILKRKS